MRKLLFSLFSIGLLCSSANTFAAYAFSLYDTPKYPPDFTHFDYVNPDAPKRGALYLANPDRRTSFDKFNPFSLKGVAPAGVADLMFESLTAGSADEIGVMYGLLADDMELAPDRMAMTFHLNPKARFNNSDPVTAADVKYSFDTLVAKGAPQFQSLYADVKRCVVVNGSTVRFEFKNANPQMPLIVGGVPVFSRKWAANTPFDKIELQEPIATGPYLIEHYSVGRNITFKRNPAYWGTNVPSQRGTYNFDRIVYRMYSDPVASLEAFKAGEFDVVVEYSSKNWARNYNGRQFTNGTIIKRELKHSNGSGMQGFIMNLRHPLFQDIRVRKALDLAMDFEWMNRQLFFNQYKRIYSYFNNSELAATGMPSADELALLEPMRKLLDPTVFGPAPVQPNTNPPGSLRANLLKARALLHEAGWDYRDGALRNAKGEPFAFEILDDNPAFSKIIGAYIRNLNKLGIQANQRVVDNALVQKRMEEFDFDVTTQRFPDFTIPGNELFDIFGSKAADQKGSSNVWGLKDRAVDKLVDAVVAAKTRRDLIAASRALDRVLLNKYIVVPHWYSSVHRIAYRNRFGMPKILPLYYQANSYVVSSWWEDKPR
ncbi:MAG TPA: extracellular solute-binding protein [Burkholderiaceae bacterium]|jgi:microcin C transport system substrate-binding protein